jgi:hypothetical protein
VNARRLEGLIAQARHAYSIQNLPLAAQLCETVLAQQRNHFEALNLLGAIEIQRGRAGPAMDLLGRAAELRPDHFSAHYNLAFLLERLGRYPESAARYRRAIELKPDHLDGYLNLGNALQAMEQFEEAEQVLRRALRLRPDFAEACNNLGNTLVKLKRHDEALALFQRAIALKPNFAPAHSNLADLLQVLRRYQEAVAAYQRALRLRPDMPETIHNLGKALLRTGSLDEAQSHFQAAIDLKPDYAVAWVSLAYAQQKIRRLDQALASCTRAVELDPNLIEAHLLRAGILENLDHFDEALEILDRLIRSQPKQGKALLSRGALLRATGRYEEALANYRSALDLEPEDPDANWNLALLLLLYGRYEQAWDHYEYRWQSIEYERPRHRFESPPWSGRDDLRGKKVLLVSEQGLGDAIMFCRFAPMVEALGAEVVLEVAPALAALMRTLSPTIQVVAIGDPLPPIDMHCPLLSLPRAFGTTLKTIPAADGYLAVDPARSRVWDQRLGPQSKPRVGLVWSGRREHSNDRRRSMPANALSALLGREEFDFHSLQIELREMDSDLTARLTTWCDELADFGETAALAEKMDVVVSVDTAVAHLAGALGKEVWILLPCVHDYRWMLDRGDTPWYRSARLFRQPTPGDWQSVVKRVVEELERRFGGSTWSRENGGENSAL